ncbi:MAG: 30S ribosomal protein S20 [Candidatus Liptonbacteria bacterium CG11_big_fil_rev_8_21_14_0_20_35_14]|uniref:Small ribosomal subunit protein bS20 n=1 Tax=Candidatus Liptonbacteria bacterium CG11_big_fil_rev_8_21_14_0_20_35_14 TaxID=1974634 RepID=A0A2H0N806_9BACT|nr:MAG: 30S ribosomal protein S20 [Candidatus Liptonbacteria bacterium CG11_big_fil_rev_8_21_14_0_20_35_14]
MPNTRTAKRAFRKSEIKKEVNVARKRDLKNTIKTLKKIIEGGDKEAIKSQISLTYKKIDKAAKVNLIKKNKASRLKSRLTKKIVVK